ncbi:MAG: YhbY family RNA-binding protein [Ruminococcaceae bacterium]|nr:YhbY family RNA-binding protein [Oscillospiraceae bacterium]
MLNSKQRAFLRSEANSYETILFVGKSGIGDALISQADGALRTRELIKGKALEASPMSAREAAEEIAAATSAEVVQVIGRCFVLFRRNEKEPVVSDRIPKAKKK